MIKRKGFTLIELLIVVAIIAILAAIAVPNFLEAQVRSKVGRSLADLRSMSIAIESYYIDYNGYPGTPNANRPDVAPLGTDSAGINSADWKGPSTANPSLVPHFYGNLWQGYQPRLTALTTPLAYFSAIPVDVFADAMVRKAAVVDMSKAVSWSQPTARNYGRTANYPAAFNPIYENPGSSVVYPSSYAVQSPVCAMYESANFGRMEEGKKNETNGMKWREWWSGNTGGYYNDQGTWQQGSGSINKAPTWGPMGYKYKNQCWALVCQGPKTDMANFGIVNCSYDPTNGTTSEGNIMFGGPGLGVLQVPNYRP